MTAQAPARRRATTLKGHTQPRIAPPVPANSRLADLEDAATALGITFLPWQRVAGRYLVATDRKDRYLYREVAIITARQQGKTTLLPARVALALRRGERVLHTAQNRDIPRKTFTREIAPLVARLGLGAQIRSANGQEEITTPNGGRYKIVAPNTSSRGETADLVIVDEVWSQYDLELMDAMAPTVTATGGQIVYLSNAGTADSVVLNDLRRRGLAGAKGLAYLEWSAAPERDVDDLEGWAEANPALGHTVTPDTLRYFRANRPLASFEREHLARWTDALVPRVASQAAYAQAQGDVGVPINAALAFKLDPSSQRASAAASWRLSDGRIALTVLADVYGSPVDTDSVGLKLRELKTRYRVRQTAYDDWTDKELAKYLKGARAVNGREFANASENFARLVDGGRLVWANAEAVALDLAHAGRKTTDSGWQAVQTDDERPITALLAAIRAVWLTSGPKPPAPRVR